MRFGCVRMNGGNVRVLKEDIPIMELFRTSVDASREALAKVEVQEELAYLIGTLLAITIHRYVSLLSIYKLHESTEVH